MGGWLPRPRIWFGPEPAGAQSPIVLTAADAGPPQDNAARAARAMHAPAEPVHVRPEDSPQAGRYIDRPTPPPLPAEPPECPSCAGLQRTIRLLEDERAQLRKQLARAQLRGT